MSKAKSEVSELSAVLGTWWRSVRRAWAAITQPGTGGLIQPGDWRCIYPDGKRTYWMSHGDAANCQDLWGGKLEWRGDVHNDEHNRQDKA